MKDALLFSFKLHPSQVILCPMKIRLSPAAHSIHSIQLVFPNTLRPESRNVTIPFYRLWIRSEPQILNTYENITPFRNSVCHPGCGGCFHVRSNPDPDQLNYEHQRSRADKQAYWHESKNRARRRNRRNQRHRARPQQRVYGLYRPFHRWNRHTDGWPGKSCRRPVGGLFPHIRSECSYR